jgi:hypothetical protein
MCPLHKVKNMIRIVEKWNTKSMSNFVEILKIISQISPNEGLEAENTREIIQLHSFYEYSKFTERL